MLNGKQKRYLRALANPLNATFQVGKDGLSDNLIDTIKDAFNTHELLKISVLKTCDVDMNELAIEIAANCHCELVQKIGRTLVFYKRKKNPEIVLP